MNFSNEHNKLEHIYSHRLLH